MPPTIAIVGRPNVGKSQLFNRLAGQKLSIVQDTPGVTRDRLYTDVVWRGRTVALVEPQAIAQGASLAKADLPFRTDDSWRAELRLRAGPVSFALDLRSRGRDPFTGALVHDASGVLELEKGPVSVAAFAAARQFDWRHEPGRVLALGEARYRITPNFHVWTLGGRVYRLEGPGAVGTWQLGGGIGGVLGF